jgi:hypothetical protein
MIEVVVDAIVKYWAAWICGIFAAILVAFRKKIKEKYEEKKKRKEADDFTNRYVLFLKIKEIYREAKNDGYITIDDLEDAEETYKHYKNMGGNGKATLMLEALRTLERR